MNYNTFVKLRGVGCLALIAAPIAVFVLRSSANKAATPPPPQPTVQSAPAEVQSAPTDTAEATNPPRPAGDGGVATGEPLSDVDREVLALQKEPLDKGTPDAKGPKWRVKKNGVTIELRCDQDKGYTSWNRAKIDANNNKQFDETWAFKKDGTVERRVAPNDDQNYTQTFELKGETWVAK
jgi:hypothetical protein